MRRRERPWNLSVIGLSWLTLECTDLSIKYDLVNSWSTPGQLARVSKTVQAEQRRAVKDIDTCKKKSV